MTQTTRHLLSISFIFFALLCVTSFAHAEGTTQVNEIQVSGDDSSGTQAPTTPKPPLPPRFGDAKACPALFAPVCGSDGKTYSNSCLAEGAHVSIVKKGTCDGTSPLTDDHNRMDIKGKMGTSSNSFHPKPEDMRERMMNGSTTGDRGLHMGSSTEMRDKMKQKAEDRVKDSVKRFVTLILASIDRLEKLITRIESRADKLDQKGVDTAPARTDLNTAKNELDAAKADLETLKNSSALILGAWNFAAVSTAVSNVKTTIDSARTHVHNAEQAIREAVKKLKDGAKAAGLTESGEATSTPHN